MLSAKLGLDTIAEASRDALEVLCTMASRLLGPGSGLFVNLRHPAQVRHAEAKKLKEELTRQEKELNKRLEEALQEREREKQVENPP